MSSVDVPACDVVSFEFTPNESLAPPPTDPDGRVRYELPTLLAAVDYALTTGSYLSGANLALDVLCDRLRVSRGELVFDPEWSRDAQPRSDPDDSAVGWPARAGRPPDGRAPLEGWERLPPEPAQPVRWTYHRVAVTHDSVFTEAPTRDGAERS